MPIDINIIIIIIMILVGRGQSIKVLARSLLSQLNVPKNE